MPRTPTFLRPQSENIILSLHGMHSQRCLDAMNVGEKDAHLKDMKLR